MKRKNCSFRFVFLYMNTLSSDAASVGWLFCFIFYCEASSCCLLFFFQFLVFLLGEKKNNNKISLMTIVIADGHFFLLR